MIFKKMILFEEKINILYDIIDNKINKTNNNNNSNNNSNNNNNYNYNSNNTTNNINNNNNIMYVTFGKEDINALNIEEKRQILNSGESCLLVNIEKKHFNDRLPQQKNIIFNSYKSNKCKVFENNDFALRNTDDVFTDLLSNSQDDVQELCTNHSELFQSENMKNRVTEYLEKMALFLSYEDNIDKYPKYLNDKMKEKEIKSTRDKYNKNRDYLRNLLYNKKLKL